MLSAKHLTGTLLQYDNPDWIPLESLVDQELAQWFMWMHCVQLEDHAIVHAYKHVATRRYVHLAEDGRAFSYIAGGDYREVTRDWAIVAAFEGWESLLPRPDDSTAYIAALRRAIHAARQSARH